jgi:hypothetical protein
MEEELFKLNPTVQVTTPNSTVTHGLTKREYFAAMALQGLLTINDLTLQECAISAVRTADLLIAELNK